MNKLRGLCALLAFASTPVWAQGRGMEDFETAHNLNYGAGIASPSVTTALIRNPAGLIHNQTFKIMAEGITNTYTFNPPSAGGGLFWGNGFVGGGLAFNAFGNSGTGALRLGVLHAGIGAQIPDAHVAFGTSFHLALWNADGSPAYWGTTSPWGFDAGILFMPQGMFHVGLTMYQIGTANEFLGAGVAFDPSEWATMTVDAIQSIRGAGFGLKPGLGMHFYNFQMGLAYGIPLVAGNQAMSIGPSISMGVRFNYNFHLEAYYNEIALIGLRFIFQI